MRERIGEEHKRERSGQIQEIWNRIKRRVKLGKTDGVNSIQRESGSGAAAILREEAEASAI